MTEALCPAAIPLRIREIRSISVMRGSLFLENSTLTSPLSITDH
jgi:hypothetical protein